MRRAPQTKAAPRQEDGPRINRYETFHVLPQRASTFREKIRRLSLIVREIIRRRQARYALGTLRRAGRSYWLQTEVAGS